MDLEEGLLEATTRSYAKLTSPPSDKTDNFARELLQAFRRHSERTLLVDTQSGRQWTGASLLDYCGRLATGLIEQVGLKPNQVVMTICDHSDREICMALGVVCAGGAIFGTTPTDSCSELETLCSIVKPDLFIVSPRCHLRALKLCQNVKGLGGETKIVWLNDNSPGDNCATTNGGHCGQEQNHGNKTGRTHSIGNGHTNGHLNYDDDHHRVHLIDELLKMEPNWKLLESVAQEQIKPSEHILTYMLTSGSTGRPKVVPSTHEELIWGLYSMISACHNEMIVPAANGMHLMDSNNNINNLIPDENNNNNQGLGPFEEFKSPLMPCGKEDIFSGDLPLDHGAGFNTMLLSLWLGAKFIVMPSYDVDAFWQAVSDYGITCSISSTTFCYKLLMRLKSLIDSGSETERWNLSSFRYISSCGAKLAFIDLVREVQKFYPNLQVTQAYGCTEIGFMSMVHLDDCQTHLNSTGYLFPGIYAKVVDINQATGEYRVCKPNERGELIVWARSKFKGYRCHEADDPIQIYANCHDESGLFYRTGDQAHFDQEGRLYIHGRFKDTLFLMEDWKILPVELEDVVNEHPLVEMSAIVGVPDPNLPGCHAPKAFVKLISPDSTEVEKLASKDKELFERFKANDRDYLRKNIYDFVANLTAKPKHLTGGVRILDEFPRVGLLNKVDRKALKMMD